MKGILETNEIDIFVPNKKRGRGRPRKNQELAPNTIKNKIVDNDSSNDEIILKIPVSLAEIKKHQTTENNEESDATKSESRTSKFIINDFSPQSNNEEENSTLKQIIQQKETEIKNLEKKIEKLQQQGMKDFGINIKTAYRTKIDMVTNDGNVQVIPEKTSIPCFWCTHNFSTYPCYLPIRIIKEKYEVFGNFCSLNCAASYSESMNDSSYNTSNRYALIKKMHFDIFGTNEEISYAPPREAFQKYGGKLSYEEYTEKFKKINREYRLIYPPMTSVYPIIEEGTMPQKVLTLHDISRGDVLLSRTKPLPTPSPKGIFSVYS